jgi:hypothetical protein
MFKSTIRVLSLLLLAGILIAVGGAITAWYKGYDLSNLGNAVFQPDPEENPLRPPNSSNFFARSKWMGDIEEIALNESSGLASSNLTDDVLWSINDSGDSARIFAMTTAGGDLGEWAINLPEPTDWEAMDSFVFDDTAYLLIADVGDNFSWRPYVSLLVVPEPDLTQSNETPIEAVWQQKFRYPDGPRDCEAVAVNVGRGEILLMTKRLAPNELYKIPLKHMNDSNDEVIVAEKIAIIDSIPRPSPEEARLFGAAGPYMGMPTGMTSSGNNLLVTTMRNAYLLNRADLSQPAVTIKLPFIGQREAITFARNSATTAYVSRERKKGKEVADIFRLDFATE